MVKNETEVLFDVAKVPKELQGSRRVQNSGISLL